MKKWNFYTSNELKPAGWLRRQLEIQAQGLSGNLDKVWPSVRDSAWIGGEREGWERVPYWLDGFIPLAYLLEDRDMITRAKKYMDAIISFQKPDGWICPCKDEDREKYDTWAVQLIAKVLTVYYDCSKDERIPPVVYRVLKNYYELLQSGAVKLFNWGHARWYEAFIAIDFTYKRYPEEWLVELGKILKQQGVDHNTYVSLWKKPLNKWQWGTHIVNLAMMLKAEAVTCDLLQEDYTDNAQYLYDILYKYNGTPVETFTGDECLAGLSPIQGTELCSVVELMYSYELLYAYTGDKKWAERLEVIAFNALPATISDDMWAHQYVQMSNQIACQKFPGKAIYRTNLGEAGLFGLEPHFGCCTANFNQGWPKLALSAFMYQGDTVINVLPVPSSLKTEEQSISLETNYPFDNSFKYTVEANKAFSFKVRIPSFAETVLVDGEKVCCGEELSFVFHPGEKREIYISYEMTPYFMERPYDLKTVKWGSLVFSVPIRYEKVMKEYEKNGVERKYPYCDYEYVPISDWNYAYSDVTLEVEQREVTEIPFSSEKPPVVVHAKATKIAWGYEEGYDTVCAKMPQSRMPLGEQEDIRLYPYGAAKLRVTELPLI